MTETNLRTLEGLKQACATAQEAAAADEWYRTWGEELHEFLNYVRSADLSARSTPEFQARLWDDNPVAATGQGKVSVHAAIDDSEFRRWLAEASLRPLPVAADARVASLQKLHDEIVARLGKFTTRRPWLKIHRAMASLFPDDFTTIAYRGKLRKLRKALVGEIRDGGPQRHRAVLDRLEEALGPTGGDLRQTIDRMRLPWLLYAQFVAPLDEEATETPDGRPGSEKLVPLPAARRRRGLTGISGGFASVLAVLEPSRDGISREDLKDEIRAINPSLKETSVNVSINVLMSELNCLRREGDQYVLTDRGEAVLESGDPSELMDWLITQILGVDHVLVWLRDEGGLPGNDLVKKLQTINPGWTTNFAPTLLVNQLRFFGAIDRDADKTVTLTESGKEWAERIDWVPEFLPAVDAVDDTSDHESVILDDSEQQPVDLPDFGAILSNVALAGHFPDRLLQRLHTGIWAHQRRHFAVLTGLSGSGKTLLARAYGKAIAARDETSKQLCTIAVQPAWYDPSSLLGYVNPMQTESYSRTPFLEFLLSAAGDPSQPYTVVLDEMNLSRPEQYLAPILSAMETGAAIHLHSEGPMLDGIPNKIRYPSNLVIVGTVNMDETTHGLSDKILDRAFTIEFWQIDLGKYPRWGSRGIDSAREDLARTVLEELMDALVPARLHFGWRTVDDVLDYLARDAQIGNGMSVQGGLDSVIYAKILPKLRGDDSPRFKEALTSCASVLRQHGLKESCKKVLELQRDLAAIGSARFWR